MIKLFDSERKVMEVLWREGALPAGQIVKILKEETGWNRNTTYTVIKKCVDKGAIKREEPGFMCSALISRQEVQDYETEELIDKMFDGSKEKFFAAFLDGKKLSKQERLELIDKMKKEMKEAAKLLEFELAAELRDKIQALQGEQKTQKEKRKKGFLV